MRYLFPETWTITKTEEGYEVADPDGEMILKLVGTSEETRRFLDRLASSYRACLNVETSALDDKIVESSISLLRSISMDTRAIGLLKQWRKRYVR